MAEVWPPSWREPELKGKVIDLLCELPLSGYDRKFALFEWCKVSGAELTAEDVERVTGRPAGEL